MKRQLVHHILSILLVAILLAPPLFPTGGASAQNRRVESAGEQRQQEASLASIRYVKPGASGGCSSWDQACTLHTALGLAIPGDQIWIAAGVYTPGPSGNRSASFQLSNGVALYGGFTGVEIDLAERDWLANPTTLSGDIDGNGLLSGNAYHVVSSLGITDTARLDGLIISGGNADGASGTTQYGGGLYTVGSRLTLQHVTVSSNHAFFGGGLYNDSSNSLTLTDVSFSANSAQNTAGGMYNNFSSPTLTNVTFSGNSALFYGGGMSNYNSGPTLTNVTFSGNSAVYAGGMYNYSFSNPTLTNVVFYANSATSAGGAMFNNNNSSPTITNVSFSANSAILGGGIYNTASIPTLTNVILWGNTPEQIAGSFATVTYSDVQGGYDGEGDEVGNIDADPLFVEPAAGNLRLQPLSPAIDAGNNAAVPPSITSDLYGNPRFVDISGINDPGAIVDMGAYEVQSEPAIIYVDKAAPGPIHDGRSWAQAFTDLQAALGLAVPGDQVWIASGEYTPGPSGSRSASFQLENGVALYGSFAGTEASLDERDLAAHPTTLSGDIDGDGLLAGNAYHVVSAVGITLAATLDGLIISGGNADGPTILDRSGGGLYAENANLALQDVIFSGNGAAYFGGGMSNYNSSLTLTNVTFSANSTGAYGGGMYNDSNSSLTLTNVTFSGNSAGIYGGGMSNYFSSLTLTNVTFTDNRADLAGGGMYNESSAPTLTNAILWDNTPDQIAGDPAIIVTYSDIQLVDPGSVYTGTANINQNPLFGPLDAYGGFTPTHALGAGSPAIDAGLNSICPATDQRGQTRPIDGNLDGSALCDMGAYEFNFDFGFQLFMPLVTR